MGYAAMTAANGYNKRFQPLFLSANGPAGAILSLNYDFHAGNGDNGNVYQIANGKDGTRTQNFAYDPLNRIQQAWTSGPNGGWPTQVFFWLEWGILIAEYQNSRFLAQLAILFFFQF